MSVSKISTEAKPVTASVFTERDIMSEVQSRESLKERLLKKKAALSDNARTVLEKRYLKKDENGKTIETPEEMFFGLLKILPVLKNYLIPTLVRISGPKSFIQL